MALATDREKPLPTNVIAPGSEGPDDEDRNPGRSVEQRSAAGGYFSVYKKGQGYWTRMGTAGGAAILIALICNFVWQQVRAYFPYFSTHTNAALGLLAGVGIGLAIVAWILMNRQKSVDFLIATDGEMKKVNWTSRAELFGSTRVVIVFMFAIALLLFAIDVIFGYIFHWLHILKSPPF